MLQHKLILGQCLNNSNGFVCSERRAYQNYPCPYGNLKKCPCYIPIDEDMIQQWEKNGVIRIPAPAYMGKGELIKG